MRLKNSDAFDIRSLSSDATNIHEASSILEDRDELGSVGGDSVGDACCTKGQSEQLSPGGSCSGGTTSGSSPGDVLPKHFQAAAASSTSNNGSPPSATSAVASVQAALAALQAGQMSLNQVGYSMTFFIIHFVSTNK